MSENDQAASPEQQAEKFVGLFNRVKDEVLRHIVGYEELVSQTMFCLFSEGHVLLEGMPGLGKTMMLKCLSQAIEADFARIQFTPDLMPADIVGTTVVGEDEQGRKSFRFHRGPVFNNIILADEINRATPKTQSALLEAMQDKTVSVSGTTHPLTPPFFVLGTQNPIEMEGTYPLPEAQVDRFMFKLNVPRLSEDDLVDVISRTDGTKSVLGKSVIQLEDILWMQRFAREVLVADSVKRYAVRLVLGTHAEEESSPAVTKKYVKYGASPRGIQALIFTGRVRALMEGRFNLSEEDIRYVAKPALRHRVMLNFEGEADGIKTDDILEEIEKTLG